MIRILDPQSSFLIFFFYWVDFNLFLLQMLKMKPVFDLEVFKKKK